jgi:hypothetical protein
MKIKFGDYFVVYIQTKHRQLQKEVCDLSTVRAFIW